MEWLVLWWSLATCVGRTRTPPPPTIVVRPQRWITPADGCRVAKCWGVYNRDTHTIYVTYRSMEYGVDHEMIHALTRKPHRHPVWQRCDKENR